MSIAERLRAFVVLDSFTLQQLSSLGAIGSERRAPPGQVIFQEGEEARELIFLIEGKIALQSRGSQIADASAPALVGEMGALRKRPRIATAVTAAPSLWLAVSVEDFRRLVEGDPEIGRKFFENLSLVLMGQLEKNNLLIEFLENIRQ